MWPLRRAILLNMYTGCDQELLYVQAKVISELELQTIEHKACEVREKHTHRLEDDECKRNCDPSLVEQSMLFQEMRRSLGCEGITGTRILLMVPGMEIGYVVKDASNAKAILREMPRSLMLGNMGSCWTRHGMKLLLLMSCITLGGFIQLSNLSQPSFNSGKSLFIDFIQLKQLSSRLYYPDGSPTDQRRLLALR